MSGDCAANAAARYRVMFAGPGQVLGRALGAIGLDRRLGRAEGAQADRGQQQRQAREALGQAAPGAGEVAGLHAVHRARITPGVA